MIWLRLFSCRMGDVVLGGTELGLSVWPRFRPGTSGFSGRGCEGGGAGGSENLGRPPLDWKEDAGLPFTWFFAWSGSSALSWDLMSSFDSSALINWPVLCKSWFWSRALRISVWVGVSVRAAAHPWGRRYQPGAGRVQLTWSRFTICSVVIGLSQNCRGCAIALG